MKRKSLYLLLILAAAGVAYFFLRAKADPVTYRTEEAERGEIVAKVTASGTLSALVTVQVGSQVSGRVQAIHADFNSAVRKGQLIAKIDPLLFDAAIRQAGANRTAALGALERAKAQERESQKQYDRYRQLAAKDLLAPSELDAAEAAYHTARAQVRSAEGGLAQADAALHQARVNLQYTNIYSPITGIVISRNVDIGQTVAASLQAPTLFVIAEDLAKMQVDTSVAESDIGRIRAGQKAVFTVDAYPGERFDGTVRQVRNAPQNVQNVVTYNAVIDVANPEQKLKPGMTANVAFTIERREGVLRVPNAALRYRPAAAKSENSAASAAPQRGPSRDRGRSVWVLREGLPAQVEITTGLTDGSHTEVSGGGLQPGDRVIVEESRAGDTKPRSSMRRFF